MSFSLFLPVHIWFVLKKINGIHCTYSNKHNNKAYIFKKSIH